MSSGSTNKAASEGLDLNSEAVPLGEEDVSVGRVTESTAAVTLSVDENLKEEASDAQGPAHGTNLEGGTAEFGVSDEGRNLLETFAQGSDVCDGSAGAHGDRGSSEEGAGEFADVGLIKEDSERETKESVDAGGDGKLGGQPDVALTLKLGASDAEELKDTGEVTEPESSMTITELAFEEIHVASGERAVELENSEVLNSKGDVPEPMDLDEKPSLETVAQGSDVCDGSKGAQGVRGSSEEEGGKESVNAGLIKEDAEKETKKSVDAAADGKLGVQPDVVLTLKLGAFDAKELKDRDEVTEAGSSIMINELTFKEVHVVASGEGAVELENSEVLNSEGDAPEPMNLDEKASFPEKNQGVGVGGSTEAYGATDTDPSVSIGSLSNCVHKTTISTVISDVNSSQNGIQELVSQIVETPSNQVIRDQNMDLCLTEANANQGPAVTVDTTLVAEAIDESKAAVQDQNQDADVQIAGACGCHHEDQSIISPSPELGASMLVDNQSMGFDVETVAVDVSHELDENLTESQSQPIASDFDVGSSVVDLGCCPCTDVKKKVMEEVLNEDEQTEVKVIEDDAIHPGPGGNQKSVHKVLEEDGGIVAEEMGDNVTNPGADGNQKTVGEVFEEEEEGSRVKEMLDDVTCQDRYGNQNTADNVFKENEGTGVKEMAYDITHLEKDLDKTATDKVDWEDERTEVREVGDGVTCLGTDGNLKAVDEIFQQDEGTEIKDGNQMILNDALREVEGTEAKEMGDDVTHLSSDGDHRNIGEVVKEDERPGVKEKEDNAKYSVSDCLDENLNGNRVDSHVNEMIEKSEQVTIILNPEAASINDNQIFYGLPTEEEGEFSVSDLVWGKVKSHPWWPGQIFDPSDASEQAMKYRKKDSFLVAYFGDRTFAWNEASLLKPFRAHFSQMEKQTNLESFRKAVSCALDEIARRVELGLVCSCTSEEVYVKAGSQMIENPGIREKSSRRKGVNAFSASSFEPEMLVDYIRALALSPYGGFDRLELVIAQMQLLAVYRLKGYSCLPKFQLCGSLVENEADSLILAEKAITDDSAAIVENDDRAFPGKVKLKSRDGSFRKRKQNSEDGVCPIKKERSLSELMAGKKVSSSDGNESVDGKPVSSLGKKHKAGDSLPDDSVIQNRKRSISLSGAADADSVPPKRSFKVGESICRVASQLTGSPPILKCNSEKLRKGVVKVDQNREHSTWDGDAVSPRTPGQRRKIVLPTEHSSPEEMLSQLCLAARDPMKGYSFLTTIIGFFSEFRNFVCLDHTSSWKHKMSSEKVGGKKKKSSNSNMDSTESYSFEDMQDSYWTDRIVQIGSEEQPLEKSRKKRGRPRKKMFMLTNGADNSDQCSPTLDILQQDLDDNAEQPVEIPVCSVDANSKDYNSSAALILSFSESDADSIPSEKNLNIIFRHFGPLKESETEVLKTTNCARVVFKRRTDAEVALSSAGKFSIFGPMRVSYRLMCWPSTSAKDPSFAATQLIEYVQGPQLIEDVTPQGIEDIGPQSIEDMSPQGIEDVESQGIEDVDMAPLLIEDVALQGIEDVESQGREDVDMAPLPIEDVAPQGIEDMAPQGIEDMAPQGIGHVESQAIEDVAPQGIEDVAPQGIHDVESQGIEDVESQGIEDVESQGIEDAAPQGIEDGAPQLAEDVGPQAIEDMVPAPGNEDMVPQGIEDVESQDTEYMAPRSIEDMVPVPGDEDMAPQGLEYVESQGTEDMPVPGDEDMAPQGLEDVESQGTEDMAPQGIEDMAPVRGNIS